MTTYPWHLFTRMRLDDIAMWKDTHGFYLFHFFHFVCVFLFHCVYLFGTDRGQTKQRKTAKKKMNKPSMVRHVTHTKKKQTESTQLKK